MHLPWVWPWNSRVRSFLDVKKQKSGVYVSREKGESSVQEEKTGPFTRDDWSLRMAGARNMDIEILQRPPQLEFSSSTELKPLPLDPDDPSSACFFESDPIVSWRQWISELYEHLLLTAEMSQLYSSSLGSRLTGTRHSVLSPARLSRGHLASRQQCNVVAKWKSDWSHILNTDNGKLSSQEDSFRTSRLEEDRQYFRTVYDFSHWQKHRREDRFHRRLRTIFESPIMMNILPQLQWVAGVSCLAIAHSLIAQHGLFGVTWKPIALCAAAQAFITHTSVALSLLLVFRTNTSYGRWDEARKMWGLLLNRSRDLMRQGATLFEPEDRVSREALGRWLITYARAFRHHCQPEDPTLEDEVAHLLSDSELQVLQNAEHKPNKIIHIISQIIRDSKVGSVANAQMSANLTQFNDILGGCERLLRAPIPVSYTRHTARFLFAWLTILPFGLVCALNFWTVPVMICIAAVLCGIEEIGVQVEEPLGILPLNIIANRIEMDVHNILDEQDDVADMLMRERATRLGIAQHLPISHLPPSPVTLSYVPAADLNYSTV
eukprot:gene18760-25292_t